MEERKTEMDEIDNRIAHAWFRNMDVVRVTIWEY